MSVMNGKLYMQEEPWNWHPAWRSKEGASEQVFHGFSVPRCIQHKMGPRLCFGRWPRAHGPYTSLSSPAVGLVWEVDCFSLREFGFDQIILAFTVTLYSCNSCII
ncbi:unnamed protein product [Cladocopium goreaui]|uniref:Uncharacterized protein n=1 Tax=Cladocopium goreaui TaxID=2562237 RepID=A0A9P1G0I1_9DINO|nr:unnamed protein product [Cladocopium goreaui]